MDQGELRRKVAFITGASVGIGQAVAVHLARQGFDLALAALAPGSLMETCEKVAALGSDALPLYFDVSNIADLNLHFAHARDHFGTMDALVNNAAVPLHRPALEVTESDWDGVFSANLRGCFFLAQRFAQHLIEESRCGGIVNIASTHGIVALGDRSTYGIAKAGLIHMTKCLAIEWADAGIRVNCVAPATISTPSREAALAEVGKRQAMVDRIPLRRFGTPHEVAAAVAYLLNDDAGFVTGHTLVLDGGLTAV